MCEVYTIYLLTLIFVPGKEVTGEYGSCDLQVTISEGSSELT